MAHIADESLNLWGDVLDFRLAAASYQQRNWAGPASKAKLQMAMKDSAYALWALHEKSLDSLVNGSVIEDRSKFESLRSQLVVRQPKGSFVKWSLNRIAFKTPVIDGDTLVRQLIYSWTEHRFEAVEENLSLHGSVAGPLGRRARLASNSVFAAFMLLSTSDTEGGSDDLRRLGTSGLSLPPRDYTIRSA